MNKMIRRASLLLVAILASIHVSATQLQGPATWT